VGWAFLVSDGRHCLPTGRITKPLGVCYGFADVFMFFVYLNFWGRGAPRGLTVVPLGREMVSSYRLSIQTTLVFGTVWPQFALQVLTGGKGGRLGLEMGVLGSLCTTSYRLTIVTIGLSLTVFAVLRVFQMDRQADGRNWFGNRWLYTLKCVGRQKCRETRYGMIF